MRWQQEAVAASPAVQCYGLRSPVHPSPTSRLTLLAQPPDGDARLLAAHNQVGVMLRHAATPVLTGCRRLKSGAPGCAARLALAFGQALAVGALRNGIKCDETVARDPNKENVHTAIISRFWRPKSAFWKVAR